MKAHLGHLESRNGNTTAVGGLSGSVGDGGVAVDSLAGSASSLEDVDGLLGRSHVGSLSDDEDTSLDEELGLLARDLVLSGTGEGDVEGLELGPGALASEVLEALELSEVNEVATLELELSNLGDEVGGEASRAGSDEGAAGVGERDDDSSELDDLEGSELGDVSGSRKGDTLALPVLAVELAEEVGAEGRMRRVSVRS